MHENYSPYNGQDRQEIVGMLLGHTDPVATQRTSYRYCLNVPEEMIFKWCARRDSNSRPTGSKSSSHNLSITCKSCHGRSAGSNFKGLCSAASTDEKG